MILISINKINNKNNNKVEYIYYIQLPYILAQELNVTL